MRSETLDSAVFFDSWAGLGRTLVVGVAAYFALILMLRISGKRTLSKLNAFDLIVTVALGSTLGATLTSKSVPLAEGLLALGLLVLLQFVVSFTAVRWRLFNRMIKAEPSLLLRSGQLLHDTLRRVRISEDEVLAAIREAGGRALEDAEAVFLESDGSLSAILKSGR